MPNLIKVKYKKVQHSKYTVTLIYDDKSSKTETFTNSGKAKDYLIELRKTIIQPTEGE